MPFLLMLVASASPLLQNGYLVDAGSFAEDYMVERALCLVSRGCLNRPLWRYWQSYHEWYAGLVC
jgi:hypothetical protein